MDYCFLHQVHKQVIKSGTKYIELSYKILEIVCSVFYLQFCVKTIVCQCPVSAFILIEHSTICVNPEYLYLNCIKLSNYVKYNNISLVMAEYKRNTMVHLRLCIRPCGILSTKLHSQQNRTFLSLPLERVQTPTTKQQKSDLFRCLSIFISAFILFTLSVVNTLTSDHKLEHEY